MTPSVDVAGLREGLDRVQRRRTLLALARGVGAGLLAAPLAARLIAAGPGRGADFGLLLAWAGGMGALLGAGTALLHLRRGPGPDEVLERGLPASRNLVRTAWELLHDPGPVPHHLASAIQRRAAALVASADLRRLLPSGGAVALLLAGAAAWGAAMAFAGEGLAPPADGPTSASAPYEAGGSLSGGVLEVEVIPPPYSELPAERFQDPERVEALAGSRLVLRFEAPGAEGAALHTRDGLVEWEEVSPGVFSARLTALEDGFLAVTAWRGVRVVEGAETPGASAPLEEDRRLVALTVVEDTPPQLRVTTPGRDLYLSDGRAVVELEVEAEDDLGLAELRMLYTRVRGSGELYDFQEGEIPLEITREGPRRWIGRARWDLAALALDRGEAVVYRAVARDRRPGGPPGESESWVVEVVGGDAALAGGFAGEDEMGRYALSQQMVVVYTERLLARRATLTPEDYLSEARVISAAQRRVRAEFVFMLGGSLEDDLHEAGVMHVHEEAHALADQDASEGRLQQRGRLELTRAIQAMSRAVTFLDAADLAPALEAEQQALRHLQQAFTASRYILRAFSQREELDPARRLTGDPRGAGPDRRPVAEPLPDPRTEGFREVLGELFLLLAGVPSGPEAARRASELAGAVLGLDAVGDEARAVAAHLGSASTALLGGWSLEGREALEEALAGASELVRGGVERGPGPVPPLERRRLQGAIADQLRRGGGG